MRVLVSFGSKRGGTAGLAAIIGGALTEAGCAICWRTTRGFPQNLIVPQVNWTYAAAL